MENEFRLSFDRAVEVEARTVRHQKAISVAILVVRHGVAKSGIMTFCLASCGQDDRSPVGLCEGAVPYTLFHQGRNRLPRDHASFRHGRPLDRICFDRPGDRQFSWFRRASGQGCPRKGFDKSDGARLAWLDL